MISKESLKVYSDGFSCFIVDSFDGLPAMLPGELEYYIGEHGLDKWNEKTSSHYTKWKTEFLADETAKIYDKYGHLLDDYDKQKIIPKIKKKKHRGYLTAEIRWLIPDGELVVA